VSRRALVLAGAATALAAAALAPAARAQSWSLDLSAGRIVYTAVPIDSGGAHLAGMLRYQPAPAAGVYGGGALPFGGSDPVWTVVGGGGRWWLGPATGRIAFGLDAAAESFVFRDRVLSETGSGASADLVPFVRLAAGRRRAELRAGWRGLVHAQAGATTRRGLFETGARVTQLGTIQLEADARFVHADGTTYPFVGGALQAGGTSLPLQVRVHAGRWLSQSIAATTWGAAVAWPLGAQASLWAGVRRDAPDPLYWNSPRRSWSVGVTRRLGPAATRLPAITSPGTVIIRVPVQDAGGGAALSIAGDFTNWTPVPMRREGAFWVARLTLAAGVYQYAFRAPDGEWFVPASINGRRDDGFGGHVAVLVVS
jgi:hypothetical protein